MRWTLEQRRAVCHPISALFAKRQGRQPFTTGESNGYSCASKFNAYIICEVGDEFPNGDAELPRLVGQVLLIAGAGEDHDADRQHVEHLIVALERRCLGVFGPIGFEGDLRDLAVVGPAGCDAFGALR
jgi:hypothetical protein